MDHVTVITGGSGGIGAATTRRLAAGGHGVAVGYLRHRDAADAVVAEIRAAGGRAAAVRVDITDEGDVAGLFAAAARLGPVTGLVNNAGITGPLGPLTRADPGDLRRVVEVNVVGYLLCARAAVRAMSATGGAIVNVSSAAATLGSPNEYVHYAAAKAAVDTMTLGLAQEVGPLGIRVNAVAPGVIRTTIHAAAGDPDRVERIGAGTPLERAGEPAEIAAAIAWLLSPEASYVTGAVLRVAGGR